MNVYAQMLCAFWALIFTILAISIIFVLVLGPCVSQT